MEKYQGVKFNYRNEQSVFEYDERLIELNNWATLFSELGLAPTHPDGAYGNFSYRTGKRSFIITKSAMTPSEQLDVSSFSSICHFDQSTSTFTTRGKFAPSSESFLHNLLYQADQEVNAILHGHSSLFNEHAKKLEIPTTDKFYDYGTTELAESALKVASFGNDFFILKDHGFIALGKDIPTAGKRTLSHFSKLISLLQTSSNGQIESRSDR
jgi:ribulose-5-phosphate 4-epimerase/fuculose-1-phosphate aldolase